MINKIYTIYDVVAQECGSIWTAKNDEVAKRKFIDVVNSEIMPVQNVDVADYELLCLGSLDTEKPSIFDSDGASDSPLMNGAECPKLSLPDQLKGVKDIIGVKEVQNGNS